jgi:Protein of unknown function (DUF3551)
MSVQPWTIAGIGIMLAAAPVQAQTYDPNYPVCLQTFGRAGNSIACRYTSMAQCRPIASGRAAQCITNPFFGADRTYRRPHRMY